MNRFLKLILFILAFVVFLQIGFLFLPARMKNNVIFLFDFIRGERNRNTLALEVLSDPKAKKNQENYEKAYESGILISAVETDILRGQISQFKKVDNNIHLTLNNSKTSIEYIYTPTTISKTQVYQTEKNKLVQIAFEELKVGDTIEAQVTFEITNRNWEEGLKEIIIKIQ